jgi:type II secretory pathway pseudopilin PulG
METTRHQSGFTYLALLFIVATLGALLALSGVVWSTAKQRAKERELLFVGNAYRTAIGLYYERAPGTLKHYPQTLDALLLDTRQLATTRYLRRLYIDPLTATPQWGLVRAPDGGIMGVYSLADVPTIRHGNFDVRDKAFEGAASYSGWRFVYEPALASAASGAATRAAQR